MNTPLEIIIEEMQELRLTAKKRALNIAEQDHYLTLVEELAKIHEDKITIFNNTVVKNRILCDSLYGGTPVPLAYDPTQDGKLRNTGKSFNIESYWNGKEAISFIDDLFFSTLGFTRDPQAKHHLFQAAKYASAKKAYPETRITILNSILPLHNPVLLNKVCGYKAKIEGRKIIIDDVVSKRDIENVIAKASAYGYDSVQFDVRKKTYEEKKNDTKDVIVKKETIERSERLQQFIDKHNTAAHTLVGLLPKSIQKRVAQQNHRNFDQYKATKESYEFENTISLITTTGSTTMLALALTINAPIFVAGCAGGIIGGLILKYASNKKIFEEYDHMEHLVHTTYIALGNPFLKPIFYPIELYLNNKDPHLLTLEATINRTPVADPDYTQIATTKVSKTAEENLVPSTNNFHQFGLQFMQELQGKETPIVDRKNNAVVFQTTSPYDIYTLQELLVCTPNKRQYMIIVSDEERKDDLVARICESTKNEEKITRIKNKKTRYLRITEYKNNDIVADNDTIGRSYDAENKKQLNNQSTTDETDNPTTNNPTIDNPTDNNKQLTSYRWNND